MAAVASKLPHQMIAFDQLRRGRLRESLARLKLHDFMVTLEAVAFDKSLRRHWENPMMVVEPTVFLRPIKSLLRIVRRVRCPFEIGRTPLPIVADRAAHLAFLVRAG